MQNYWDPTQLVQDVNAMSDHNVQVITQLKLVSQNLQGPYAIKATNNKAKFWFSFDIPNLPDGNDPAKLAQLTGMTVSECQRFISANKKDNSNSNDAAIKVLTDNRLGSPLGEGGYRLLIETNERYKERMTKQVDLLKKIIDGGADILSIQEQPYCSKNDQERNNIFKEIMQQAGYVLVAFQQNRDVGIWVKEGLKTKIRQIPDNSSLSRAVSSYPLRGCAATVNGVLCINLHVDRINAPDTATIYLLKLLKEAKNYASKEKLSISITGDMNLFQLPGNQQKELMDAGFSLEKVKGQEKHKNPNYEAFFTKISPPLAYFTE